MKLVAISTLAVATQAFLSGDVDQVSLVAPKLGKMMHRALSEPEILAEELRKSPIAQIAPEIGTSPPQAPKAGALPIVITHGMGDSCFNGGMKSITKAAGAHAGVYSVCVPGGDNDITDTLSAFLVTMNKNVDRFAAQVRADKSLSGGFNAFGLSQGNSIIRGYIQRYNDPPVHNYLSIHGTVMGVAGFPQCNPAGLISPICDALDEALGALAYDEAIQGALFQANYFRDPLRVGSDKYLQNSQIAAWNNENPATANATYASNFASVGSYSMVKAQKDTMVYPNEGEWWGQFEPGQFKTVQTLQDTPLYAADTFGLKTVDAAGKIRFNSTDGQHLQFTGEQLESWIDMYF